MDQPFFSIVIPVYNTVRELERCVNSITVQSFSDFEVILVDDGSTDGSGDLCDQLSRNDSRIKTIHKVNGGCSEARNTGIRASQGRYLMFVDSDDMWDDAEGLEKLQKMALLKSCDVVCFGVGIYNEEGELEKVRKVSLSDSCGDDKLSVLTELVYSNQYFSACYVRVYDRQFLLDNNLLFVDGLLCEDIEWSARVMIHARTISVYNGHLYKRIQRRSGSQTATMGERNVLAILQSIENGVEYAQNHCEDETFLNLYLEYWAYQYAMVLGFAPIVKASDAYTSFFQRLKKYSWLLRYDHVKKVKAVRKLVSLIGLGGAISVLSAYYRLKK